MSSNDLPMAISEGVDKGVSLLRRRDFLALGSLVAVSQLVPGFVTAAFAQQAKPAVRPMSLAYIEGSDRIRNLKRLPRKIRRPLVTTEGQEDPAPFWAIPAASLPLGDPNLIGQPLQITIHGLYPPDASTAKRRAELPFRAELDWLYPVFDPIQPMLSPFFAWSLRRDGSSVSTSVPTRFTFPLDWEVLPQLSLKVTPADGGPPVELVTRFTLDDEPGSPRLQRGVYLLGLSPEMWERTEISLPELARRAPAKVFSILVSVEPAAQE
ncbi:MAG TPA: hypothetical protein VHN15_03820 [Thermoanaerobaculia bacterium]|nr:hypothetical protein [Thermoanaerobaculia bacterium]